MISIVTSMYYSENFIHEFYNRIKESILSINEDYEIIFVNDGSPDRSLENCLSLIEKDNQVTVIDLSRNFGHHKALMTGLSYSKGDYVFLIDCDLEEEPELLISFWEELHKEDNLDVVYGIQSERKGNLLEKISGSLFYKLFNIFSEIKVPKNLITCRLMTRKYVDALIKFKEQQLFLGGLFATTGFNQKAIPVKKLNISPTTYTLSKKFKLFFDSFTSFSSKPLEYISYLGLVISIISGLIIIYILLIKLFVGINVSGWTSILISIWFLGGLNIFFIGIIGIYLSKVFIEVKNRPYTLIKNIYTGTKNE